jgi:predicted transcriptional regulator
MEQRSPDPFFDQLRADIQEGIDEADRGELIDEAEVWKHLDAVIDEVEQKSRRL